MYRRAVITRRWLLRLLRYRCSDGWDPRSFCCVWSALAKFNGMRLGSIFVWLGFYLVYHIHSCEWSFEGSCICNRRHDMSRQDSSAINWKIHRTILSAWPRPHWSMRHHPCTSVLRLQEDYQVIWSPWRTAGATIALAIHVHLSKISEIVYYVLTHWLSLSCCSACGRFIHFHIPAPSFTAPLLL